MVRPLCEIIMAICDQQKKDLSIEIQWDRHFILGSFIAHTHDAIQRRFEGT